MKSFAVVVIMLVLIATIGIFVISTYSNHSQSFNSNDGDPLYVIYDTPASGSDDNE